MFSIGLLMQIKPGCYDEYQRAHDQLWPQVAQSMADNEVSMAIFRWGDRLFVHAIAPTESCWLRSRQDSVLDQWHQYMVTLLVTNPQGDIAFEKLPVTFAFGLFRD